jgi:hypothetical protein
MVLTSSSWGRSWRRTWMICRASGARHLFSILSQRSRAGEEIKMNWKPRRGETSLRKYRFIVVPRLRRLSSFSYFFPGLTHPIAGKSGARWGPRSRPGQTSPRAYGADLRLSRQRFPPWILRCRAYGTGCLRKTRIGRL